ncbi:MAG: RagB/SusD family nutrient uptake outer membrane protein [Dysgonamonadaceae bacterium]|jgi:hypothetical protein|nr:RagB/SusD family nutrient uptake outer membrane protein [Dysgonamonadaceae bacterium]
MAKNNNHLSILNIFLIFALSFQSCIDTTPEEVVAYENFYAGLDDADAAILGLYGQFMGLAEQVVVLNELRADLMDVTDQATTDLEEISRNIPGKNNPWANVSKFYGVIQTCNDILHNYNLMLKENKMTQSEYDERYSDVTALRCWVYLQLSNLFGKTPYITEPIIALEDLDNYKQNVLNPDELIRELIRCMETLPTLENYRLSKLINGTIDGYSLTPFFIHKKCLLGDLYLYNNDYEKAARIYREIMAVGETEAASNRNNFRKYRLYCDVWRVSDGTPSWFQILYALDKNDDADAFYNAWRRMFMTSTTSSYDLEEMIWFLSYDTKFAPDYTLSQLFNPVNYNKGKAYLKPSDYAVEEIWGNETQKNGYPFDARGYGGAYDLYADGKYYIRKYSYMKDNSTSTACGNWFLYRAALLHLRYAEAVNRAGYPKLAWALVNDGIHGAAFNWKKEDGSTYPGDSIQYSSYGPGLPYPEPYYFDGRLVDQPYIRGPWRYNGGVRGRANLPNIPFPDDLTTTKDSVLFVEKLIIREAALELGFEGNRWGDLVRVARRLNHETPGAGNRFIWDENIAEKFARSGITAPDMSSEDKWYLPLYE